VGKRGSPDGEKPLWAAGPPQRTFIFQASFRPGLWIDSFSGCRGAGV
jgi:hypothetical protein